MQEGEYVGTGRHKTSGIDDEKEDRGKTRGQSVSARKTRYQATRLGRFFIFVSGELKHDSIFVTGVTPSSRSLGAPSPATMTVAASSKIELAVCFENVARNIFGSLYGTMTGCVPRYNHRDPNRARTSDKSAWGSQNADRPFPSRCPYPKP